MGHKHLSILGSPHIIEWLQKSIKGRLNETRVIERLNQKHSSGRKRVVLCGQREREGEKGWRESV